MHLDSMLNINLKSHFFTIQAFLPHMISQGKGHVVVTSSVMGYVGISQMSKCHPVQHALLVGHSANHLAISLAKRVAPARIAVQRKVSSRLTLVWSDAGDYVATKHALVGLVESLRYELDKKCVICPLLVVPLLSPSSCPPFYFYFPVTSWLGR